MQEISCKSTDVIISVGEKLSCLYVTALLKDRGVPAQYVNLYDIVPEGANGLLNQGFYDMLAAEIGMKIRPIGHAVPVITGYFGSVPGGLLNQIGRGYTDLCAALVAIGLGASELQVWKEVDGIFTADPRKVPTARLLAAITPAEAAELTFYGSEVIHPFTMEQVIRAHVPIRIKNVMNPGGQGTVIFPDPASAADETQFIKPGHDPKLFRSRSASSVVRTLYSSKPKRPTAVTVKKQIMVMNVHSNKRSLSHGFFAKIFTVLDKYGLSVDLISTSEVHVSMAIHSESALLSDNSSTSSHNGTKNQITGVNTAVTDGDDGLRIVDKDLSAAVQELSGYGTIDISPRMAILSLVGAEMKHMVGIAGRMFTVLGDNDVNIEMISQGASEINISCVIEERGRRPGDLDPAYEHLYPFGVIGEGGGESQGG